MYEEWISVVNKILTAYNHDYMHYTLTFILKSGSERTWHCDQSAILLNMHYAITIWKKSLTKSKCEILCETLQICHWYGVNDAEKTPSFIQNFMFALGLSLLYVLQLQK